MSCCLPSVSAFGVVSVLDFSHSNRCVEVSHCCFNLQFPDDIGYRESFHLFICHLYPFFGEVSLRSLAHLLIGLFVILLLSFKSSLCILDNKYLSEMPFTNIFSQSDLFSHSLDGSVLLFVFFLF